MESTETISPRNLSASASATADLPEAVGPARKMEETVDIRSLVCFGGGKAPSSKRQAPEIHRAPSSNPTARAFAVCDLVLLWILDLGSWCLFGICDSRFGICRAVYLAQETRQGHACRENSHAHQLCGRKEAAVDMAGRVVAAKVFHQ